VLASITYIYKKEKLFYPMKKSLSPFVVQAPRLASDLPMIQLSLLEFQSADLLSEASLSQQNFDQAKAEALTLEEMRLQKLSLREAKLARLDLRDCEISDVDFSNSEIERGMLTRARFENAKLLGLNGRLSHFRDVVFKDCNLNLADFGKARFQQVRFENCQLKDLQLSGANFKQVQFKNCDLSGLDLSDVTHVHLDLRGSSIAGFRASAAELKGLILDPEQALGLIHLLGVTVLEVE
jgi:uncharacterized protein YjbI with pentapeptide repeats